MAIGVIFEFRGAEATERATPARNAVRPARAPDDRSSPAMALLWHAVGETAAYADHIIDTGRRTPVERVAHFFLELHRDLRR